MRRHPLIFFILVFALSVPFYIVSATGAHMPGMSFLPASALMGFVPTTAALIITYHQGGSEGAFALLTSIFVFGRKFSASWIYATLLFMPIVCLFEFWILNWTGNAVPIPQIEARQALFYFVAFFIGAIGEELGWQGYAYPSLRVRHGILKSAFILGVIWALWHLLPYYEMGRSSNWIFWHLLATVALRLIIVWLFENTTKSILIAVLFHTMINLTWALFPVAGSFYDPFITFTILIVALGLIVAQWHFSLHELRMKT